MPTVIKIKCDSSEYAQELEKTIELTRAAAAQIAKLYAHEAENVTVNVDADAGQVADAEKKIEDVKVHDGDSVGITVSADAESADAAAAQIARLEAHDGADVSVTVSADAEPADAAAAQIARLEAHDGDSVGITVRADMRQAEAATGQIARLEAHDGDSVGITVRADMRQAEAATGQIARLEVHDGADVSVTVSADAEQADSAAAQIARLEAHDGADVSVTVSADAEPVEAAAVRIARLEAHDGEKTTITIDVKQTGSNLEVVKEKIDDVKRKTVTIPPSNIFTHIGGTAKEAWRAMTNFRGGAKRLIALIGAGGGAVGVFAAGAASLVKLGVMAYNAWRSGLQEASEQIQRNTESIREAAEANEQLRQKSDGYADRLSELSKQESLSNADKVEAIKLVKALSGAYGDLGVRLDETTGKLVGVDEAMAEKLKRDKDARLGELRREIKNLEDDNRRQAERRDTAGVPVWFDGDTRFGGRDEVWDANKKIEENAKRLIELRRKYREVLREDKAGDYRKKREAEEKDAAKAAENAAGEAKKQRLERERAGAIADEKDSAKRRAMLEEELRREKDEAAKHRAEADKPRTTGNFFANYSAAMAAEKKYQESLQRQYELQRQINAEKKKEAEFNSSLADQAKDLAARAAERAGRGREYAERRALEEAEKRKGGKLTASESDAVKRLSALEYDMSHADRRGADLAIKTNALTARGGFRSGAVAPDAQKYTKLAVDVAKRQLSELGKIGEVIKKWDSDNG